ncbi:MAG: ribulose-phosphate 3-epimerase [Candidatus Kapaibacterium sp.]
MNSKIKIAPSLLSADFGMLKEEIKRCEDAGADLLHLDIMDGHFVPNISYGAPVVKAMKKYSTLPLDCHLMISDPDKYIPDFAEAGVDLISVHAEATHHLHRTLSLIKQHNCLAGIALNPATPLEHAFEAAEFADFILLMSVNPGFGGQKFISSFIRRAEKLRDFLNKSGLSHVEIEVDGGIKPDNAGDIAAAGANMIVSGSGLFNGDMYENILKMKNNIESALKVNTKSALEVKRKLVL